MFEMRKVRDVGYLGFEMFGMWDVNYKMLFNHERTIVKD